MYSTCLFCHAPLGANEMLEHFPVGRRIAFDAARGRLWVICPTCRQWSLSPLDERWEAVEEAERLYRGTRLRAATDQIGLARLRDGTELVRIGDPLRPEFAAWRYGERFGVRWRKRIGVTVAVGTAVGGYIIAGPIMGLIATGGMWIPWNLAQFGAGAMKSRRVVARLELPGGPVILTDLHAAHARIVARPDLAEGWRLSVPHFREDKAVGQFTRASQELDARIELGGALGMELARAVLPRINRSGGRSRTVAEAVRVLEEVGDPNAAFASATRVAGADARRSATTDIGSLAAPVRLALEMAAHEEVERLALEGELAALERAWRDAEEVAAIADSLTLPERIAERVERLRG